MDLYLDIMSAMEKIFESEKGEAGIAEWVKENLPKRLGQFQKRLEQNSNPDFLVGDKLSAADVVWNDLRLTSLRGAKEDWAKMLDEIFGKFDKVQAYYAKRKADFQKRLDTRPDYYF